MRITMTEAGRIHRLSVIIKSEITEHYLILAVKVNITYSHAVIALACNALSVEALRIIMGIKSPVLNYLAVLKMPCSNTGSWIIASLRYKGCADTVI